MYSKENISIVSIAFTSSVKNARINMHRKICDHWKGALTGSREAFRAKMWVLCGSWSMNRNPMGLQAKEVPCVHKMKLLSPVWLLANPRTIAYQAPLSMEISRQEQWSGLPFPSPGDLPNVGIESRSPTFQADALPSEPPGKPHPDA